MKSDFQKLVVSSSKSFEACDITQEIQSIVDNSGITDGIITITSLHTSCALSVNENEERLFADIENYFLSITPPDAPYKHNDLHLRINIPPDEPENAHAHLIAMMIGNNEIINIYQGKLVLGQYQSILLLEMDGPRERSVSIQIMGSS